MDIPTKTSQDVWSLAEGTPPPAPPQQWGNEPQGVPGPVTEPVKGEIIKIDAMKTSGQDKGNLPEGN